MAGNVAGQKRSNMSVETIEYKGHEIEIEQDMSPSNPCEEFDQLGTMVCSHSRYNLGHEQVTGGMSGWYDYLASNHDLVHESDWYPEEHGKVEYEDYAAKWVEQNLIVLPLYLYDHSGITIRTAAFSCPWDSGQVGFVYVHKDKVKTEYSWKRLTKARVEKVEGYLKAEVGVYDHYLTGSVYGYSIEGPKCDDSCWGYYGYGEGTDWDYMIQCAKDAIDSSLRYALKQKIEKVKEWIQNQVPLQARAEMLGAMA